MRNISFSMTTEAYRQGWKTVTRRMGWQHLKPGEVLMGVEKCQGLKKGEKVKKIHPMRVVSAVPEPLMDIVRRPIRFPSNSREVVREGFTYLSPMEFVKMFCNHNGCDPETEITRIEFEHIIDGGPSQ